jgi:pyruvate/2-oxoglutarate dehydrogenase complex dihydrolipoamide dehydrogenase (E3) component
LKDARDRYILRLNGINAGNMEVYPLFPPGDGFLEHSISSDIFFELDDLPKRVVVVGAGYIAAELAGGKSCMMCTSILQAMSSLQFDYDAFNVQNMSLTSQCSML